MIRLRRAVGLALTVCCLLAGCASRGPLLDPSQRRVELADTPFFPQRSHQCGPAALATALGASGVSATPDVLTPLVYLPGRQGSLQIEMEATPRRYDRLAYRVAPELDAITAELDAGRPVLVLHNYGLPFWPRWHYAVVVGYDAIQQQVLLRSGTKRRQIMSARNFMRAWDNGERWAIVLLRPGELPAQADRAQYLSAVTAFERAATPASTRLGYDAAIRAWPDEPVAYVGRGTAQYRAGALRDAAADYQRALALDATLAGARNNLAMTWLDLGCPRAAAREAQRIVDQGLSTALRSAIADTRAQISAKQQMAEAAACPAAE